MFAYIIEYMSEDIRACVLELLQAEQHEMSAAEIAEVLDLPYQRVYRALVSLVLENSVTRRRLGKKMLLWRYVGAK